jgi:DNA recombination-dependent growth factor C
MPILKGSASYSRYRVDLSGKGATKAKKELTATLSARAFVPLEPGGEKERAQGFVELADPLKTEFSGAATFEAEFALFAYRVDEVRIPAVAVRQALEAWTAAFEQENGRKPGKKEKADAKQELRHTLKSRYPLSTKTFDVSWNLEADYLSIWAGSRKAIDEVQAAVEQAFGAKLVPVAPVPLAIQLEIAESALVPTPALSMPEQEKESGSRPARQRGQRRSHGKA